jgi:purine catabolism regulator
MNPTRPNDVNLGDILRLALPLDTKVLGGASQAKRIIHWVVILSSWSDLTDQIETGDLVIIPAHIQEQLADTKLNKYLIELSEMSVAGIILFREISEQIAVIAGKHNLPLIMIPKNTSIRETHHAIAALLVDQQRATSERAMQLYRRLSEMSREGLGLGAMTDVMSNLTGNIIIVQDKRLEIRAESYPSDSSIDRDVLYRALKRRDQLPPILRNRKAAARARQSYWQQILPVENFGRLISPIVAGDRARGYLSVVGLAGSLDLLDSLTVEHGAAACALEMAKAKAVSEAKKSFRGDFLEGLLAGTLPEGEIHRLAGRLDHDTRPPHAVITLTWIGDDPPTLRRLETTLNWLQNNHVLPSLVHRYAGDHLCVFQSLRDPNGLEAAHELSRRLIEQIEAEFPNDKIIGGMSGPAESLAAWPSSYQEALQAMDVGNRLKLSNQIVEFNSLGVYQLLRTLEDIPSVRLFSKQIIGPLAKYDKDHRGSLVQTLEAYFNHHGNISQTAESLFVHRNTLLYRMERIQELTGQDINNAEMRLALHLSLNLWQLRSDKSDEEKED